MLSAIRRRMAGEEGMTLVEVLIVTVLLGVIIPPAMIFVMSSTRSERQVAEATAQQQDARVAMESLTRHLREAAYPEGLSFSSSAIFSAADGYSMTFYTDIDSDGVTESVGYSLDPVLGEVSRTVVEPDCSVAPCAYAGPGTTTTAMRHIRNGDLAACGETPGTSTPMFIFYKTDLGNGTLTEFPPGQGLGVPDLVDISYVKVILVSDIRPTESPVCQRLESAVELRNWRG